MATVFKKTFTKPIPADAEIVVRNGQQVARWRSNRSGKMRSASLTLGKDGAQRILMESACFFAKYRDGKGIVRVVATGCRDETAARAVLAGLERRAELAKAGVISNDEQATADHGAKPIAQHFGAFGRHLQAKGVTDIHREDTGRYLRRLETGCGFATLADLDRSALESWLAQRVEDNMSARTRNAHQGAMVSFCNWCVRTKRLPSNPFHGMPKANERADRRRQRRSMTEDELGRLLRVAGERPLRDAMTVRRGQRKGQAIGKLREITKTRLTRLGQERALMYKTMVLTGLRKREMTLLTVGQLVLDAALPYAQLDPAGEKNRRGSSVPIRPDLAADLKEWLAEKLRILQRQAASSGELPPTQLPPNTPVFEVPTNFRRILERDLKAAGIPKADERGRTLDLHALRHTFGTLLSKGGVQPRTAQEAMRHSTINLTMNVYTDPKLLDVHGAGRWRCFLIYPYRERLHQCLHQMLTLRCKRWQLLANVRKTAGKMDSTQVLTLSKENTH